MDMFLASCVVLGSAVIAGSCKHRDTIDGWFIGMMGGLLAGAVLHIL